MSLTLTINLEDIVQQIKKAASESISEEDLKIRVENILKNSILDPLGIPWGRYEYTLVSGVRPDALHAHVIIEYEKPGSFEQKKNYDKAIQQVKKYIVDHAQGIKDRLPRYFGVTLDGYKIGFVKYRQRLNDFDINKEPLEINRSTIARLIEAIVGLRRKALDVEELLKDFGPTSEVTRRVIKIFYNKLQENISEKSNMLFNDWKRVFSQVCAYDKNKLKGLETQYELEKGKVDVEKLFFSLHTYFALLMKLLAAEVGSLYIPIMGSYLKTLEDSYYKGYEKLKEKLEELEEGGLFTKLGIVNFLEGDYFAWYLNEWDAKIADSIALIIKKLSDYDPSTAELEPDRIKDLFKRLYQNLVPKKIRHDLGEYYTPDWLAELVLNEVGFTLENFNKIAEEKNDVFAPLDLRLLDPACGSGTFLVLALRRLKEYIDEHWIDKGLALKKIIKNIIGFDLNPLAVMASRANYLIAIGDMLRDRGLGEYIEIPVYLADSIMVEQEITLLGTKYLLKTVLLKTVVGNFEIPTSIIERGILSKVLNIIKECIKTSYTPNEFIGRLEREVEIKEDEMDSLKSLYEMILKLEKERKNRIWLGILENSFAPFLVGKFNYIVGNPPWVNWENLAEDFRKPLKELYKYYDILPRNPNAQTKIDLSMIFTYRCMDRYLVEGGMFGFLINDAAFKAMAGNGFRKFSVRGTPFKVRVIHDLVTIKPFEGASNRTAMFIAKKNEVTEFPISYKKWFKLVKEEIPQNLALKEVMKMVKILNFYAEPLGGYKQYREILPLLTFYHKDIYHKLNDIIGRSLYKAHAGPVLIPSGVYRIQLIEKHSTFSIIRNLAERDRKFDTKEYIDKIENELLYPILESGDVSKWLINQKIFAIIPYNLRAQIYPERELKIKYPNAFAYLSKFKDALTKRSHYRKYGINKPFYFIHMFSDWMLSNYKVVWNQMGNRLDAAVAGPISDAYLRPKPLIPEHVIAFIPVESEDEAHYICSILNSSLVNLILQSIAKGGKNFATPGFINMINIRPFNPLNQLHIRLAELSKKAHQLARENNFNELKQVEEEIDRTVAQLYGLTSEELEEIKKALKILREGEFEEEIEETLPLEPDIIIENPVLGEGKNILLDLLINNPLDSEIKNVKIKVEILDKKHEEFIESLRGEHRLNFPLGELKKGEYKVKLTMYYELEGSSKKIEKEVSLFIKEKETKKIVDRGSIEELFGD